MAKIRFCFFPASDIEYLYTCWLVISHEIIIRIKKKTNNRKHVSIVEDLKDEWRIKDRKNPFSNIFFVTTVSYFWFLIDIIDIHKCVFDLNKVENRRKIYIERFLFIFKCWKWFDLPREKNTHTDLLTHTEDGMPKMC